MPKQYDVDLLVSKIERSRKAEVSGNEREDIELWLKGRLLSQLVLMQGWDVVVEMLQSYVTDALKQLANTDPKHIEEVRSWHASAFASQRLVNLLVEDVQRAIEASRGLPEVIQEYRRTDDTTAEEQL